MLYYDMHNFTFTKVRRKLNHFCLLLFIIIQLLSQSSILTNNQHLYLVDAYLQSRLYETPSVAPSLPVDSIQAAHTRVHVVGQIIQQEQKCQPVNTELCNIDKYSTLQPFNNTLGHTSISSAIAELHKYAYLFNKEQCKRNIQLFLCSLYTPVCVNNQSLEPKLINNILLPCRDICESAKLACLKHLKAAKEDWPLEWTCGKFKYYTEDKLCVINNTNDTNNNYNLEEAQYPNSHNNAATEPQENDQELPIDGGTDLVSGGSHDTPTPSTTITPLKCSDDEFDCKLRDFHTKGMHLFCIDKSLVCDGRKDCLRNDTFGGIGSDEGLDEANCEVKCSESELICDNKCITKQDICNGLVDCSSGSDETNCYDHVSGVIRSIVCISGLFLSIYILIQCFKLEGQKTTTATSEEHLPDDDSHNNSMDKQHYRTVDRNHLQRDNNQADMTQIKPTQASDRNPIYQEPAYSIATRSDYERVNTGGCSGASSVCMYSSGIGGGLYHSSTTLPHMHQQPQYFRCHYDHDNAPAPPPSPAPEPYPSPSTTPTPGLQSIFSSGSISKLYVNFNSPHKTDLLD